MFTLEAEAKLLEAKVVEEDEVDGSVTTFFEFRRKSAAFELPTALPELTFSDWLNLASVSELELSLLLGTVVVVWSSCHLSALDARVDVGDVHDGELVREEVPRVDDVHPVGLRRDFELVVDELLQLQNGKAGRAEEVPLRGHVLVVVMIVIKKLK
ncbi:hypothetical protein TYRP_020312 [Tyrophagus putrescentiae]|nr:hypothetical protein TYRP_020312 [Tyrophagus putrescentiae]